MTDETRKLDALVAEKVMGWALGSSHVFVAQWVDEGRATGWLAGEPNDYDDLRSYKGVWCPSTDIAAAWEVVAAMRDRHNYLLKLEQFLMNSTEYEDWTATFEHRESGEEHTAPCELFSPLTAPLAICLAALKAVAA